MASAVLVRLFEDGNGCFGQLIVGHGQTYYTCENMWRDNERGVSCIPEGSYHLDPLKNSASGKYTNCYWVRKVKGRSGVLIHSGNTPDDTLGCILPGKQLWRNPNTRAYMVTYSRVAMRELWQAGISSLRIVSYIKKIES